MGEVEEEEEAWMLVLGCILVSLGFSVFLISIYMPLKNVCRECFFYFGFFLFNCCLDLFSIMFFFVSD